MTILQGLLICAGLLILLLGEVATVGTLCWWCYRAGEQAMWRKVSPKLREYMRRSKEDT